MDNQYMASKMASSVAKGWSEEKTERWLQQCIVLGYIEDEIKASGLDYSLLMNHMNMIERWLKAWDEFQRIEVTMK